MNAYCLNCLGEHPPAMCPEETSEHLKQAAQVAQEINLEALAWKRQAPDAQGWRTRLKSDDDPGAPSVPVSHGALLEQLSQRFTLRHARAVEARHAGALAVARKKRRLRPEVKERVDELIGQADATLGTSARDRVTRSMRFLESARDLDDLDPRVHLRLGFVCARDGQYGRATEAFERAAEVLPQGTSRGLAGSAKLLASRASFLGKRYKDAWELAVAAEQSIPHDGGLFYQKALVASHYPQANRSVRISLRRAVEMDPVYFALAALDPAFDPTTWKEVIWPLLREIEDESVQNLLEHRDHCRELFLELEDIAECPAFSKLPSSVGGNAEMGHDAQRETRSLLSWTRSLLASVESTFDLGPAARAACEGTLNQSQQQLRHWILAWQKALLAHVQDQAAGAIPGDDKPMPKGSGPHVQRLTEAVSEIEQLEMGLTRSKELLDLARRVTRETDALARLRSPPKKRKAKRASRWVELAGKVGFYLAVAASILAALGADLLVLHSPSFDQHPFWTTAACAAFTVYLPELVARLARPRAPGASWRLHELAFLPAYLLFPVLPAAWVVRVFPSIAMFMLMMGVCAIMSLLLIVGIGGRR